MCSLLESKEAVVDLYEEPEKYVGNHLERSYLKLSICIKSKNPKLKKKKEEDTSIL